MNHDALISKGFIRQPNGEYTKPTKHKPVGGLENPEPEHRKIPALASSAPKQKRGKGSVQVVVTIVSYRRRLLDDDNLAAGAKPLRDAIAERLGCDDGDRRIRWEYDQVETRGKTGTQILITPI